MGCCAVMAHCGQHILEMQLFHELKQRFPNIPDNVVSYCIKQIRGERKECRCILEAEHWLRCKHYIGGSMMAGFATPGSPSRPDRTLVDRISEMVLQTAQTTYKKVDIDQLIKRQLERKERLEKELSKEKEALRILKQNMRTMKSEFKTKPPTTAQVLRLDIHRLSLDCQKLYNEVDQLSSGSFVPSGETNAEFYQNIPTGQTFQRKSKQNPSRHRSRRHEDNHWVCQMCTFRNHPRLDKCEVCDMPRISQDCSERNIRIHVRHHNYPCKVVHSWVL